ncbi:MAG: GNAT family N-acetyltransferase [Oscillospiraceae bacterium]|nr:GNAT family N-acetyltransferase [Oscillospiraceae bacterium]
MRDMDSALTARNRKSISAHRTQNDVRRWKFEIEWNGRHVGWVSSYPIDEHYEWIGDDKEGQVVYRAVGIDICEPDAWGKGVGVNALRAFIQYYFEHGIDTIYTQTWSGNVRMLRCAEKLGFTECNRNVGTREVNGQKYDALTFKVNKALAFSDRSDATENSPLK